MPKQRGNKVKVKVGNGATPTEVFTALKGEVNARMSFNRPTIDASDKSSNEWGASFSGNKTISVTASGRIDWPDASGFDRLRSAWESGDPINCELALIEGSAKYTGPFMVTSFEINGESGGMAEFSFTLESSGAATYAAS